MGLRTVMIRDRVLNIQVFYNFSLNKGMLMHLGPPLPLTSSEPLMGSTSMPLLANTSFDTTFLQYVITFFGAMASVLVLSFFPCFM